MTNLDLAKDYIIRAGHRLKALEVLYVEGAYPDVIRESQEILELILKAYLRSLKIDPPKWHDVSSIMVENSHILHKTVTDQMNLIVNLSKYLRKERENSFYGDDDLIPLNSYTKDESARVMNETKQIFLLIKNLV
jgi:HEPN domain-containing protein